MDILDSLVIGAGVAGLTCAQQLHRAGHRVALIDKSRGLGGRLATRRLPSDTSTSNSVPTHGDHGVCYLKPKHPSFQKLLAQLTQTGTLHVWTETIHTLSSTGNIQPALSSAPCYASTSGITAVAKALAEGLTIHRSQRAIALEQVTSPPEATPSRFASNCPHWQITTDQELVLAAQRLILAIPTPQAIALLETLPTFETFDPDCLAQLRSVTFSRCITAIATYSPTHQARAAQLPWQGITCPHHDSLGWIGLDSSKQLMPQQPVVIVQSNDNFAQAHFEASDRPDYRQALGPQLLAQAAAATGETWLTQPTVLQVHRWGYAVPLTPLGVRSLSAQTPAPLWFTGDWCGGNRVEAAFLSGLATAEQIHPQPQGAAPLTVL